MFGKNPLIWLFPINSKEFNKGGYSFEINKINKLDRAELKVRINELNEESLSIDLKLKNQIEKL